MLLAALPALAGNPWEEGGSLDACIQAVLKQRPGILTGWQQSGGGDVPPYVVSVLAEDGTDAEAFCDPARPDSFKFNNKTGLFRASMYRRATFPEPQARAIAPLPFTGPVRLTSMALSVGLTGRPTYEYQMFLPSNHKAVVEIDAVTGRLNKGRIE
ncbi:MAG TPA: hypothetical protein VFV71_01705 [Burkholderiales bacterium]|nr:hypothetical protein [Burkholderiales bacterium]